MKKSTKPRLLCSNHSAGSTAAQHSEKYNAMDTTRATGSKEKLIGKGKKSRVDEILVFLLFKLERFLYHVHK